MAEAKTYWRCAACGNEILFRVSGGVRIECFEVRQNMDGPGFVRRAQTRTPGNQLVCCETLDSTQYSVLSTPWLAADGEGAVGVARVAGVHRHAQRRLADDAIPP